MSQGGKKRARRDAWRGTKHHGGRWSSGQRKSRRKLGQNFLNDWRLARKLVAESGVKGDDIVVELGAGGGMLTRQLASVARAVVAVEYDPCWAARLERRFPGDGNVRVVRGDVLEVDFPSEPFLVVANVPFGITTSILHRLLDDPTTPLRAAHLLVQEQVALKHARPSPTSLKTLGWSPWFAFSAGLRLPADAFDPKPRVDACLMAAAKRDAPLVDSCHRHVFRALVRRAFQGRGNTVAKTLRPVFTRAQLRRLARDNAFSNDAYPSALTVHQWAAVFAFMVRSVPQDRWPPGTAAGG